MDTAPLTLWSNSYIQGIKKGRKEVDKSLCALSDFTVHSIKPDWSEGYSGRERDSREGTRMKRESRSCFGLGHTHTLC